MGIFGREPTIGNSNLTQSDLDRLLDLNDTSRTDYTYVKSKSYRINGSSDYQNPRMSRLPLSYYKRMWSFRKAREAGLLYYAYFCTYHFAYEFVSRPFTTICAVVVTILRLIIRFFWYVIDGIFPDAESQPVTQGVEWDEYSNPSIQQLDNTMDYTALEKRHMRGLSVQNQEAVHFNEVDLSASLFYKFGRLFANMLTLGYFFGNYKQGKNGRKKWSLLDEYEKQKRSSVSPLHSAHNVHRRVRTSSYEYSEDRGLDTSYQSSNVGQSKGFVHYISKLFYLVLILLLSPVKLLESTARKFASIFHFSQPTYDLRSRIVYKNSSNEAVSYTDHLAIFLSEIITSSVITAFSLIVKVLFLPITIFSYFTGFLLRLSGLQLCKQSTEIPTPCDYYRYAKNFLWMIITSFIWFVMFLQSLPFYVAESVREYIAYALAKIFMPKAALLVGYEEVRSVTKKVLTSAGSSPVDVDGRTATYSQNRLFPTSRSLKYSSAFWKWLFPLLFLLLLFFLFRNGLSNEGDSKEISVTKLFNKIRANYYNDQPEVKKSLYETCSNFFDKIWKTVYSFGMNAMAQLLKNFDILRCSVYGIMQKIYAISERSLRKLIRFVKQIALTWSSYFFSRISELAAFGLQKTELLISHIHVVPHREHDLEENIPDTKSLSTKKTCIPSAEKQPQSAVPADDESLQRKLEEKLLNYLSDIKETENAEIKKHFLAIEKQLSERLSTLSQKIHDEIAQKSINASQLSNVGQLQLPGESDYSSAIASLRVEFEKFRREKDAKIAELAHALMSHEAKRNDDLEILKFELNNKMKDYLEKGLSFGLNRFEEASHHEHEEFRLDIKKMVEKQVVALFASRLAEKNETFNFKLELSEPDFVEIKRMITDALDKYDADKTGKVDYALESAGASVISTRCTEPYKENSRLESIFGIPLWYSSYSPRAVIQYRPLAAGECWAFRGKGYLTIQLSHPIYITEVSYEHLHATLHPEGVLRSAPKFFRVFTYDTVNDFKSKFLIGEYEYDISGRALQTFRTQYELNKPVSIVELVVLSNWNSDYTCLYRFRVHGRKV